MDLSLAISALSFLAAFVSLILHINSSREKLPDIFISYNQAASLSFMAPATEKNVSITEFRPSPDNHNQDVDDKS